MKATVTQMCPSLCESMDCPWNSPGQNTGVGSLSLLQGTFLTQGLTPGLLHCRRILYQLSHKGNPRTPEWVAHPFTRRSSQPRDRTLVSHMAGRVFTNWAIREEKSIVYFTEKGTITFPKSVDRSSKMRTDSSSLGLATWPTLTGWS